MRKRERGKGGGRERERKERERERKESRKEGNSEQASRLLIHQGIHYFHNVNESQNQSLVLSFSCHKAALCMQHIAVASSSLQSRILLNDHQMFFSDDSWTWEIWSFN